MKLLKVKTNHKSQVLDITEEIESFVSGLYGEGIVVVFAKHTTCALTLADLDPGTDLDFLEFLEKIIPDVKFRHPHNSAHAPDHILSSIIGLSVSVPFSHGKMILGTWQRVVLVELDGPRDREIILSVTRSE